MSVFLPDYRFGKVWDITKADLGRMEVKLLILDVDNTLTKHQSGVFTREAELWLDKIPKDEVKLVIVSNSDNAKIREEARKRGIAYFGKAHKPLGCGFRRVLREFGFEKPKAAIVGDQLFTDILGGNLFGIKTILVTPIEFEGTCFFKLKRWLERPFLAGAKNSKPEF